MNRRNYLFYKTGFFCLLTTSGLLLFLLQQPDLPPPAFESATKSPTPSQQPTTSLPPQTASPSTTPQPPSSTELPPLTSIQKLDALAEFIDKNQIQINLRLLDYKDNKISQDLEKLFEFTPDQSQRLNRLFTETQDALLLERKKHSRTEILEDGSVQIHIDPFLESGESIMNSLYQQMEKTIGAPRLRSFERIAGQQINTNFKNFGAEIAQYSIQTEAFSDTQNRYKFTRRTELEHGHSSSSGSVFNIEEHNPMTRELFALLSPEARKHLESQKPQPPEKSP